MLLRSKPLDSSKPTTTEPLLLTHRLPTEWTTTGRTDFLVSNSLHYSIEQNRTEYDTAEQLNPGTKNRRRKQKYQKYGLFFERKASLN